METITMCHGAAPIGAALIIFFRLHRLGMFYTTGGTFVSDIIKSKCEKS